ncbi:ArpU family phage packaging/lysis transcriptional regulator, partial [Streptococcus pyogenes]
IDKYLLTYPKTDCDIYTNLGYEKSQYYNMLDNALMSFSELYKEGVLLIEKLEKSWN